ncbi:MAG: radical SAM protein [Lachnospiraceae bacterium]|nr:radical SAM protein [Lachnospiraceae bacterium]
MLNVVVDMYGCPNRCLHCWLGHMPNKKMPEDSDKYIMEYFSPYFNEIAYYSWLREPDFCDNYKERWERDIEISKNTVPNRFELASFFRIVRDDKYIPFLKSVGVKKVQLTLFGLQSTQDRYIGRKGAFKEVMTATEKIIENGIIPRWQCFINEENIEEILELYEMAKEIKNTKCPSLEFFVHEGSCDGENKKLYPIRIRKQNIPESLIPVYMDYNEILTERECIEILKNDSNAPHFPIGDDITLNISNEFDVYYNFTNISKPWKIGNLKTSDQDTLINNILTGNTPALNTLKQCKYGELAETYGEKLSEKAFSLEDYKMYIVNCYLEQLK